MHGQNISKAYDTDSRKIITHLQNKQIAVNDAKLSSHSKNSNNIKSILPFVCKKELNYANLGLCSSKKPYLPSRQELHYAELNVNHLRQNKTTEGISNTITSNILDSSKRNKQHSCCRNKSSKWLSCLLAVAAWVCITVAASIWSITPDTSAISYNNTMDLLPVSQTESQTSGDISTQYYQAAIDNNNCYWKSADWGYFSECRNGYVGTGACGSGYMRDCGRDVTSIRCCRILPTSGNNISSTITHDEMKHGWYGQTTVCSPNRIINKLCGSGASADCNGYYHTVICSTVPNGRFLGDSCSWIWGTWGQNLNCHDQMVMHGFCSGGRYKNCNNNHHSHGIYCCDIV